MITIESNLRFLIVNDMPIFKGSNNTIKKGNELFVYHGCVYMNGGLVDKPFQNPIIDIINNEMENGYHYLKPQQIIRNKV